MDIVGKITGIKYQVLFTEDLKEVKITPNDVYSIEGKHSKNALFKKVA